MRKKMLVLVAGVLGATVAAGLALRPVPPNGDAGSFVNPVPMRADDGVTRLVEPGETLGDRIHWETVQAYAETTSDPAYRYTYHPGASTMAQEEGHPGDAEGHCYNDGLPADKVPPEGKTACACYQATKCDPKSSESHSCKRHCRKDKCDCCAI